MPYSDDKEHSPSEFNYPGETNDTNIHTTERFSSESVFLFFSTNSQQIAIQQSYKIYPLLTLFVRSVLERIDFGFNRTDLALEYKSLT